MSGAKPGAWQFAGLRSLAEWAKSGATSPACRGRSGTAFGTLAMTTPAVLVDNVTCSYAGKKALDAVTLTIPRGTNFALLGPNGAGKTTLISILCTLQKPDSGSVSVAGVDVLRRPTQARKSIGVVFQDSSLDDRLTAW